MKNNKTSVLVVDAQNRVQSRDVQIGVESSNSVEILPVLTEGEKSAWSAILAAISRARQMKPQASRLCYDISANAE